MLAALQHNWVSTLYRAGRQPVDGLRRPQDTVRFEIYRASLLANLSHALADTYPVIEKLVGRPFFEAAAQIYLRRHPSRHGDIHAFGGDFASFLEQFEPVQSLPYLPDVARLEWLTHQAFHAADGSVLEIDALASLPRDQLDAVHLNMHPSLQLMQSEFPVHRIWQANQESAPAVSIDLDEGGVNLAIFRDGMDIALMPLARADYDFLTALRETSLAHASDLTLSRHADFDPGQALHLLFSQRLVISLLVGDVLCIR
ncbi:MAG TPA: DNA-binding domain-containing protein [Thiobacillus sp.]